jgi:hypothetical protein
VDRCQGLDALAGRKLRLIFPAWGGPSLQPSPMDKEPAKLFDKSAFWR